ncbi:MAG: hypothetical protein CVV20_00950 [Gemmatimonadetes bacterium HGW-Gemmatimonadetes-1]|nr:MAG: hypothetical protein CVV20_00950 [Gemmatimonadetes bacterium HGW-Gemmatimonadetes-1]
MRREDVLMLLPLVLAACGGEPGASVDPDALLDESAPAPAAAAAPAAPPSIPVDTAAAAGERPLLRESFAYRGGGRDPFRSLVNLTVSGPEMPDLILVGVIYDVASPSQSVATFRETGSSRRHNVSPGQSIGRLYVASVLPTSATLRMNDFGAVREQTYSLRTRENEDQ